MESIAHILLTSGKAGVVMCSHAKASFSPPFLIPEVAVNSVRG